MEAKITGWDGYKIGDLLVTTHFAAPYISNCNHPTDKATFPKWGDIVTISGFPIFEQGFCYLKEHPRSKFPLNSFRKLTVEEAVLLRLEGEK